MSDSNPVSPQARGKQPPVTSSSRPSEDELGDTRVEDLGEAEPEEIVVDMGCDREQPREKTKPEKGREKPKKGRGEEQRRQSASPGITKKPTIVGSAYDAYQKEPAYIAPIGPIGPIPAVGAVQGVGPPEPPPPRVVNGEGHIPSPNRPRIPRWVTERMIGKAINEYGDVVDDDGSVLGRVAGDLPSMVGRAVLNQNGDVLGDDGELLGYVAEIADKNKGKGKQVETDEDEDHVEAGSDIEESEEAEDGKPQQTSSPKSIDQYIGKPSASLQVDHRGNILDSFGNIIGHFRDTSKDPKLDGEAAAAAAAAAASGQGGSKKPMPDNQGAQGPAAPPGAKSGQKEGAGAGGAAGSGKRPKNAADWKKENESPSDIYLDVKSTIEGIQLTIRIPTVFGGNRPQFSFSS